MSKDEIGEKLDQLKEEEDLLRRRLNELEDTVQNAPGSHSPGAPSSQTLQAELEIRDLVLRLTDLDRRRIELTVAHSLAR